MEFAVTLRERVLLQDGAFGAQLARGDFTGGADCIELLNITRPMDVLDVYPAYINAGADILTANTCGASSIGLSRFGLSERARELIHSGVALCREAASDAGRKVFIAAPIGPTGELYGSHPHMPMRMYNAFYEQCAASAEAGADLLIIKTMSDLREARLALLGARASTNLPVICGFALEPDQSTFAGNPPEVLALTCMKLGAFMCGANCSLGPDELFAGYSRLSGASSIPTFAMPDACKEGGAVLSPDEMAEAMLPYLHSGAAIIGGCCHSDATHTAAMRERLDRYQGNARIGSAGAEYLCSSTRKAALSQLEGAAMLDLAGLNVSQAVMEAAALAQGADILHIDLANQSAKNISALVYSLQKDAQDIPLAFHIHTSAQAEAALFSYSGIAALYIHADAYGALKSAVRYGAQVIS